MLVVEHWARWEGWEKGEEEKTGERSKRGGEGKKMGICYFAHCYHAKRGYGSWVCVSVTLHLTSQVFVHLTKDMTYLTGNEGQQFRTVFSETAPLQS